MNLAIDSARLQLEFDRLAAFSDTPAPSATRIVFTATDLAARAYIKQLCAAAGLRIREDAVGNTFARWQGSDPSLPAVCTGSHMDALPNAGRYDGTVGVLGGLEAIRALQAAGHTPARSIELLLFTAEEPTRFGIGCLGSRILSGSLTPETADALRDQSGATLQQVRQDAGFTGSLESVPLPPAHYSAFVELHIEQGPLLEQEGLAIGIVTAIAAPASIRIIIEGEGGHAGAVLMPQRHDAFLAAAEIALALESAVLGTQAIDTVGTTGICDVFPGAVNSIPSRVRLELDIRDTDRARRDAVIAVLAEESERIAARRGVRIHSETINADDPATSDSAIVQAIERACQTLNLSHRKMISRAYHDSLFMSRIAPTAMLFIPCHRGYSHRPEEYSSLQAIAQGVQVLAETLAGLT